MMGEPATTPPSTDTIDSETLSTPTERLVWTVNPMLERKLMALLGILIINAVGVLLFQLDGEFVAALLAMLILVVSLNRFFFSSTFELGPEGVTARYPLKTVSCRWEEVERWNRQGHSVWVRLKNQPRSRDIQLFLSAEPDAVLSYLARHVNC